MSVWSRIGNLFRGDRLNREIDEELESHIAEAVEHGRDPAEARRAFGSALLRRNESHDVRVVGWLDSLRADVIFGWRQLRKNKVTSAVAILSLALAIGACTSAFRLIDALLLRPLPIVDPHRLYAMFTSGIGPNGTFRSTDFNEYPQFSLMRTAVKHQAELVAVSGVDRVDLTYWSDQEIEKAYCQYVSGWMFRSLGLKPVLGRLLTENDDVTPRAHPYAVLSYDYWTRRFGRNPQIIGRSFHLGNDLFRIVGIAPEPFTGTEPGAMTDIFLPTMMHAGVTHDDWSWIRTLVKLKPGGATEPVRDELQAVFNAVQRERVKSFTGWPKRRLENFLKQRVVLQPAAAGLSWMQKEYLRSLVALAILTALVLLIACANVANLLTAQAAARAREMALRVSIGAGRLRLVQLVLLESAWLASLAAACGSFFAWWAAPFVVAMINPPDNPAHLVLPTDWRVLGFGLTLTLAVTILFGLAPALRASGVRPVSALKGGEDPHSRRRLMHFLIAAQAAFCFLVLFGAGLFVSTFERLTSQSTGFSPDRLLALDTVADPGQSSIVWYQTAEYLSRLPGVESAALAAWPLFSGNGQNGFIAVNGEAPHEVLAYVLSVSPGWLDTMRIPIIDGRDFRDDDTSPGVAVVNQAFVKEYFPDDNPIGKLFAKTNWNTRHWKIIGVVGDARYRNMREPITPTVYQPFRLDAASETAKEATFLVRTFNPNPLALATVLRHEVHRARSELRVSNIRTQLEINQSQTVRERLLAMLASFFAIVAVTLAGIGLYGVLDYSVLQRRREIAIRMAIGAPAHDIVWRVTIEVFSMVVLGAVVGFALGMASVRYIETLLYHVKPTDPSALALPSVTILVGAVLAAVPPVIRAMRIDPAQSLRFE